MFSHQVYNVVHIVGIVALMAALGGAALLAMVDPERTNPGARRLVAMLHGIGAFVVLLGGFGMLARLGIAGEGFPPWLWVKLLIWGVLAMSLIVLRRRPNTARTVLIALPILGGLAAYMAIYKPM